MDAESLLSATWFRVAQLHPQLGGHIQVRRQPSRDAHWYLFSDMTSGRQHRFNASAYQFAGRCNGRHSTDEIWETLLDEMGEQAPSQDEIIRLIGQLSELGMLQVEKFSDVETLFDRHEERTRKKRRSVLNPLSFRLNLFNPQHFLHRLDGLSQQLFSTRVLVLWLVLIALALVSMVVHWSELRAHAATYMLTPRYLILMWLCYPLIKAVHELAHGLAVRRWGGEVTQMGVALLVLVPAPFVDASAASAFGHTYQRVLVSAAGIMTELVVAALALLIWLNIEPGLARDIAFVFAFIGSVSTVLFNGNPLLRFDGYYLLCDALNLPNLAHRSNQYWVYLAQRYFLKISGAHSPEPSRGERPWLLIYAPLSWMYKLSIGVFITFWVAAKSLFLGLVAGLFLLYSMLIQPLYRLLRFAFFSPALGTQRTRVRLITTALVLLAILVVAVVPIPSKTVAEGVVWLPDRAQLRSQTDGFILDLNSHDGDMVQPGQLIATLDDPKLIATQRDLQGRIDGWRAEYFQMIGIDPLKAKNADEALQRAQAELVRVQERLSQLQVRAQIAGQLVILDETDLPGKFLKRGALLGYVFSPDEVRVRAVVDEQDIAMVQERTRGVEVLLKDGAAHSLSARLSQQTPAATHTLPSAALGEGAGGDRITDPADKEGIKTLDPVFLVDLTLPADATRYVGGRAWVHFDLGSEPLVARWVRRVRQLFLKHFNTTD